MTKQQLRAWLATARIANLPTIWSTVFCFSAPWLLCAQDTSPSVSTAHLWLLLSSLVAFSFIYCGGCLLGDAFDEEFDRENRPQRPIPSGLLSGSIVLLFGIALFADAILLLWVTPYFLGLPFSPVAAFSHIALILTVVAYAKLHKGHPVLGLLLMSSCRALLVVAVVYTAASHSGGTIFALQSGGFGCFALAMASYTAGIVIIARTETDASLSTANQKVGRILIWPPILLACLGWLLLDSRSSDAFLLVFPGLIIAGVFLMIRVKKAIAHLYLKPADKPGFVSSALAHFPAIDQLFVVPFALYIACTFPPALLLLFIPPSCIVLAKLLQKHTPAT